MNHLHTFISGLVIVCVIFIATSCTMVERPGDGDGEPPPTDRFENVSEDNLPSGIFQGTSRKAVSIDIDGDEDLDLVIAAELAPNKLLLNNGSGVFTHDTRAIPLQNLDSKDVAIADFENDGDLDLFFANEDNLTNEFYLNTGGVFNDLTSRIPVTGTSNAALASDVEGDGDADIFIGNTGQNVILVNNGNARFTVENRIPQQFDVTFDLANEDLDGDDDPDLVSANNGINRVLVNTGSGFFNDQTFSRLPQLSTTQDTRGVDLADIDGDGDLDIYFANISLQVGFSNQDRLLVNNGEGIFEDVTGDQLPDFNFNTLDAAFTDIDNDGDPDIIAGALDGGLLVFINDGEGGFTDATEEWFPSDFSPTVSDLEIADYNGDGLPDIYICNFQGQDILLFQKDI